MRTISRAAYTAALAYANEIRQELGLAPVTGLPLSRRGDPHYCAIAEAVKSEGGSHIEIGVGSQIARIGGKVFPMPRLVMEFIQQFDSTPSQSKDGLTDPASLIEPEIFEGERARACGCVVCLGKANPSLDEMLESVAIHDPVARQAALARLSEKSEIPQSMPVDIPATGATGAKTQITTQVTL